MLIINQTQTALITRKRLSLTINYGSDRKQTKAQFLMDEKIIELQLKISPQLLYIKSIYHQSINQI